MKSFYLVSNGDSFRLTKKHASITTEVLGAAQLSSEALHGIDDATKHKRDFLKVLGVNDSFRLVKKARLITKEIHVAVQSPESTDNVEGSTTHKRDLLKVIGVNDSFRLVKKARLITKEVLGATQLPSESLDSVENVNTHKRDFLKVLGVAGLGLTGTLLFPKEANALTLGGTPTSSVVGVKNVANTRVNPATEETTASLLKASDLNFDGSGYLNVNVQSSSGSGASSFSDSGNVSRLGLVDGDRHVQVDVLSSVLPSSASTETTLQTISFGGFKFAIRFATVGDVDYVGEAAIGTATSAASWRIKKIDSSSGIVITWAGTGVFNQVWDDRASLSYS